MQRRVIFDLEWNYSRQRPAFDYHGQPLFLHGEIVQIGAVDADSGEEFSCLVRPRLLPKLNPLVVELTGLSDEVLESGLEAAAALRAFADWCGQEAVLLSWSGQDWQLLKENLFLHGFGEDWPVKFVDLQRLFREYSGSEKWEPPLKEAVEHFGIEGDIRWHDALSDARCARSIYQRIERTESAVKTASETVEEHELCVAKTGLEELSSQNAKQPAGASLHWRNCREVSLFPYRLSQDSWKLDGELSAVRCPVCGALMEPADHWQNGPKNRYWYSLLRCPSCEDTKRLLFWARRRENGLWHFLRGIAEPDGRQLRDWKWRMNKHRRRQKE